MDPGLFVLEGWGMKTKHFAIKTFALCSNVSDLIRFSKMENQYLFV